MSQRILVRPEQLRQRAQQLKQSAGTLREIRNRIGRAYSGMDLETRSAAGVGGRVSRAQSQAAALADDALRMANYLDRKAQEFEQADRMGLQNLGNLANTPAFQALAQAPRTNAAPIIAAQAATPLLLAGTLAAPGDQGRVHVTTLSPTAVEQAGLTSVATDPDTLVAVGENSSFLLELVMQTPEHRQATYDYFLDVGRWMNDAFDTRGYVGRSEDLYHWAFGTRTDQGRLLRLLDHPGAQTAFFALDAAFGVAGDVANSTYTVAGTGDLDWTKTIGVNTIDTGITTAIASTGVGAAVLLINGGVQIVGTAGLGIQGALNSAVATDSNRHLLEKDIALARDALDRADLRNVVRETSEWIYDSGVRQVEQVANTWDMVTTIAQEPTWDTFTEAASDFALKERQADQALQASRNDALRSVPEFLDGVVDLAITIRSAAENTEIAARNSFVQHLPIDQSWKDRAEDVATTTIKANQSVTRRRVDLFDFSSADPTTWFNL